MYDVIMTYGNFFISFKTIIACFMIFFALLTVLYPVYGLNRAVTVPQ